MISTETEAWLQVTRKGEKVWVTTSASGRVVVICKENDAASEGEAIAMYFERHA